MISEFNGSSAEEPFNTGTGLPTLKPPEPENQVQNSEDLLLIDSGTTSSTMPPTMPRSTDSGESVNQEGTRNYKPGIWKSAKFELYALGAAWVIAIIIGGIGLALGNYILAIMMIPVFIAAVLGIWFANGVARLQRSPWDIK